MNFKKWVKTIQTSGYNGARTVPNCKYKKGVGFPKTVYVSQVNIDNPNCTF